MVPRAAILLMTLFAKSTTSMIDSTLSEVRWVVEGDFLEKEIASGCRCRSRFPMDAVVKVESGYIHPQTNSYRMTATFIAMSGTTKPLAKSQENIVTTDYA